MIKSVRNYHIKDHRREFSCRCLFLIVKEAYGWENLRHSRGNKLMQRNRNQLKQICHGSWIWQITSQLCNRYLPQVSIQSMCWRNIFKISSYIVTLKRNLFIRKAPLVFKTREGHMFNDCRDYRSLRHQQIRMNCSPISAH